MYKERISITIDPTIKSRFDEICKRIENKWGTTISRSQMIESMIVGWCKKNGD